VLWGKEMRLRRLGAAPKPSDIDALHSGTVARLYFSKPRFEDHVGRTGVGSERFFSCEDGAKQCGLGGTDRQQVCPSFLLPVEAAGKTATGGDNVITGSSPFAQKRLQGHLDDLTPGSPLLFPVAIQISEKFPIPCSTNM